MSDLVTSSRPRILRRISLGLAVLLAAIGVFLGYIGIGGPGSPFNHCINTADCADAADVRRYALMVSVPFCVAAAICWGISRHA